MGLILEYEGKNLFRKYRLPLVKSELVQSAEEAANVSTQFSFPVVVKAQVLSGGRGKRGLIQIANNSEEVVQKAKEILAKDDHGKPVTHLLIEQGADIEKELFVSMLFDRSTFNRMILFSIEGGVEIETLAKERPEAIEKFYVPFGEEAYPYQFVAGLANKGLTSKQKIKVAQIIATLANMMHTEDLTLAEINPLAITKSGDVLVLDSKIVTDDNAVYRHPERTEYLSETLRYTKEEAEAKKADLAYVDLGGEISMLSVGAGLGMITADLIQEFGGTPKNFLDAGGGASAEKIETSLRIMIGTKPKSILINTFGGITRMDEVANGIVSVMKKIETDIPMIFRMSGTNVKEGLQILKEAGLTAYDNMEESIKQAVRLAQS